VTFLLGLATGTFLGFTLRYLFDREPATSLASYRIASTLVLRDGVVGSYSADDQGVYFTEWLGRGEYGATQLVARPYVETNVSWRDYERVDAV
jgi:hypothetical protein